MIEIQSFFENIKIWIHIQKKEKKIQCVSHIRKRFRSRLKKLKSTNKRPLSDSEAIGRKPCLTGKIIKKLQNYFRIEFGKTVGKTVFENKVLGAVLFQCSEASNLDINH